MLLLALQGIRNRKGPFTGAFVALVAASALVMACATLLASGMRDQAPIERYAGTPVVVAADQYVKTEVGTENQENVLLAERARVDATLIAKLERVPGVRAAIADDSTPAQIFGSRDREIDGPGGHPTFVHPWRARLLTPYALSAGRAPAADDEVVVDAALASSGNLRPGARVRLASTGPARVMTVVGIARTRVTVDKQAALFVTDAESARLGGHPGRVDAIGLLGTPDPERVRTVVGQARVVTGDKRGEVEHVEVADLREAVIAIAGTFGGLALLIALFVVASTLGLSVLQREREVALLRAIAATPRQVRRMIAWEARLVSLAASAVGIVLGVAIARTLGGALSDHGAAPEDMVVRGGPIEVIVTVAATMLTATLSVRLAARRAARVKPTRALQDSAVEPRLIGPVRLLAGLVALGGGAVLAVVATSSTDLDTASGAAAGIAFVLVLAVAFLGPVVARLAAWVPGVAVARASRVGGFLAVAGARTAPRRFGSAVTPLVLSVAMASSLLFTIATFDHAAAEQGRERVVAPLALGSDGLGVPQAAVDDARRIAGVDAAVGVASTRFGPSVGAHMDPLLGQIVDPQGAARVLDLDVREGSLERLGDDGVALSVQRAKTAGAHVGDRVALMLGDGTWVHPRVVATYRRDLGFGGVVASRALEDGHRTSSLVDTVLVRPEPGADRARVAAALRALAARYPGLIVGGKAALSSQDDAEREGERWLFGIIAAIIFGFTSIAVVNTLTMIALARTRELALLRLIGATRRQVRSMARWEAGLTVAFGVGLGTLIALGSLVLFAQAIGADAPYVPVRQLALILGSSVAVGFVGSQIPTRIALRARAVDAIGLRD